MNILIHNLPKDVNVIYINKLMNKKKQQQNIFKLDIKRIFLYFVFP